MRNMAEDDVVACAKKVESLRQQDERDLWRKQLNACNFDQLMSLFYHPPVARTAGENYRDLEQDIEWARNEIWSVMFMRAERGKLRDSERNVVTPQDVLKWGCGNGVRPAIMLNSYRGSEFWDDPRAEHVMDLMDRAKDITAI
jgi:hypothetical protein